jgi:hypothetical protein
VFGCKGGSCQRDDIESGCIPIIIKIILTPRNGGTGRYKIVLAYQMPQKSLVNFIKRNVIVNKD